VVSPRYRIDWPCAAGALRAEEPTEEQVADCAAELAAAYNEPHNRAGMGHPIDFAPEDVLENYLEMERSGARQLLLYRDGVLVGDADLRSIDGGRAELAILVASRAAQGKGLGTRFAIMLHAFGFRALGLEQIYVTLLPANAASRRLFDKLGYQVDDSPQARSYVDEPDDVSMSIGRARFEALHAEALAGITIAEAR
jgi:RimJ/RimL family protein N-acetyltransferase